MGFFEKLKEGLTKTRINLGFHKVDESLLEDLEEQLIMADVGMETSESIIKNLRDKIKKDRIEDIEQIKNELKNELNSIFESQNSELDIENKPAVILMIGVNGAGKTTSIGKIANKLHNEGKKVLIAAGDTFRAAAVEQLEEWCKCAGCEIVKGKEGQDPSSVIFDACQKSKNENYDVLICDTAGRLQNKKHLMDELEKMKKVIDRELPDSSKETLLVIDGSTGQNAVSQVNSFKECTGITGIIITKLDGTAKGGVVIQIVNKEQIPVKFIGVGEKIDNMQKFNSTEYINAIIN